MAIQGPVVRWVADHRRHHAFSDREGDPHSPWRYGETIPALAKGLWWAHTGWLFDVEQTPRSKYAPDLMADTDLQKVDRAFPLIVAGSMLLPALVGGLWSMSWQGALTAFFWASLVRVSLLHHVTWSINSICHTIGERPFKSRDRSGNVWWLAVLSMGESWHNLHHADPTCARHGIEKGQVDSTARVIWAFEKLGWATDVRWPVAKRIDARRVARWPEDGGVRLGARVRAPSSASTGTGPPPAAASRCGRCAILEVAKPLGIVGHRVPDDVAVRRSRTDAAGPRRGPLPPRPAPCAAAPVALPSGSRDHSTTGRTRCRWRGG